MESLNLPRPRRIDEAVPANLMSGQRQDAGGVLFMEPRPATGPHAGSYAGDVTPQLAWQWMQAGLPP